MTAPASPQAKRKRSKAALKEAVFRAAMWWWRKMGKPTPEDRSYEGGYWRLDETDENLADKCAAYAAKGRKRK